MRSQVNKIGSRDRKCFTSTLEIPPPNFSTLKFLQEGGNCQLNMALALAAMIS